MKTLFSAVKVVAILGALFSGPVCATPIDIDMSEFTHDVNASGFGSKTMEYDNIFGISEFGLDGDLSSASYIKDFDGVNEPGDYGKDSNDIIGLFFGQDGVSDWYLDLDFSNANLVAGTGFIQLSAISSWYDPNDNSPLFDINLFSLDINSVNFSFNGDDILYVGDVSEINMSYDPFDFSGKKVTFELFQAASNDGNGAEYDGNALLSFNVTEVPEPSTLALFSVVLLLLSRVRLSNK
ncbi:PEP-CTERM sorting domain-containing protein [Catenovulum agarivorans]|uniref:PEP-CTERM sorting domain-containing protein n=1 Tax=Catenovulum agarivorans TaxID=1172192 RepID=UPI0002F69023|nr:PEP-CTERM sorting domain-containing protein [Catenovulum agarivorans]